MLLNLDKNESYNSKLIEYIQHISHSYTNINRYPDHINFSKSLSHFFSVTENNIIPTAGCTEAILIAIKGYVSTSTNVLMLSPTYIFAVDKIYEHTKRVYTLPAAATIDNIIKCIIQNNIKFFYLCNPNNPTGDIISVQDLLKIAKVCADRECILFIDETYFDFCNISFVQYIDEYPNIIIGRSFSKAWACAAARVGALITSKSNIRYLSKYRLKAAISGTSIHIIEQLLQNYEMILTAVADTESGRDILNKFIIKNNGLILSKPNTNFIYFSNNTDIFKPINIVCRKYSKNFYTVTLAPLSVLNQYVTL